MLHSKKNGDGYVDTPQKMQRIIDGVRDALRQVRAAAGSIRAALHHPTSYRLDVTSTTVMTRAAESSAGGGPRLGDDVSAGASRAARAVAAARAVSRLSRLPLTTRSPAPSRYDSNLVQ